MLICATPGVQETSRKTGEPEGNVPWLATRETTPLTEMLTVGCVAVVVVSVGVVAGVVMVGVAAVGVVVLPAGTTGAVELDVDGGVADAAGAVGAGGAGAAGADAPAEPAGGALAAVVEG